MQCQSEKLSRPCCCLPRSHRRKEPVMGARSPWPTGQRQMSSWRVAGVSRWQRGTPPVPGPGRPGRRGSSGRRQFPVINKGHPHRPTTDDPSPPLARSLPHCHLSLHSLLTIPPFLTFLPLIATSPPQPLRSGYPLAPFPFVHLGYCALLPIWDRDSFSPSLLACLIVPPRNLRRRGFAFGSPLVVLCRFFAFQYVSSQARQGWKEGRR